jgi:hypothetical protein
MQALQILRLALLWGPYSIVAPQHVTSWTGSGWLCRIYITAALGIAAPLSSWFFLFLLAAGKAETETSTLSLANKYYNTTQYIPYARSTQLHRIEDNSSTPHRETPSPSQHSHHSTNGSGNGGGASSGGVHKRVGRAFFFALLCTLPVTLLQTGAAWVSVWVDYQGTEIEQQPRTLIGYFLANFWYGTPTQCDNSSSDTISTAQMCTLCTFPAASAIIHLLWTFIFLFALWTVTSRIAAAALNRAIKKRLRVVVLVYTLFAGIGCVCLGVSVVEGPFTWLNQAMWLGYVATVAATALLLSWEVVIVPVHSSHVAARRVLQWEDESGQLTYAQAVVAAPDFPPYRYPSPLQQNLYQLNSTTLGSSGGDSFGGGGGGDEDGNEASAPLPPFPLPGSAPLQPPYCHIELATQPPTSAIHRKTASSASRAPRLFSRNSTRALSSTCRFGSDDGGGDNLTITARDVLAVDGTSNGNSTIPALPSPFMTPQHQHQYRPSQQQQQVLFYPRAESPVGGGSITGGGGGTGVSTIPALYNRIYRPNSASSSTAGSIGGSSILGGGGGGSAQGRSTWNLTPPSPRSSAPSVAAVHLASYYQPQWVQQQQLLNQQQRGSVTSLRPSTASSTAPSPIVSPGYQSYGSGRINYSGSAAAAAAAGGGGGGLGLFGYGLGGLGGGSGRYHNPSSSFGRGYEPALGTPTSSGTATPTPQSQQQLFPPPPWR